MSTAPSRPDLEDLAAYLDGRLDAEGRAAVELRLAADEDYYEVFLETTRFQREEASRRGPWVSTLGSTQARRGRLAAGAVAAALVLAVGWSLRPAPNPLASADSADLLRDPQVLADPGFKIFRSGTPDYSREDLAYRLGVWTVDLEVLLRLRDIPDPWDVPDILDVPDVLDVPGVPDVPDTPSTTGVNLPYTAGEGAIEDSDTPDSSRTPEPEDRNAEARLKSVVAEIELAASGLNLFRLKRAAQLDSDRSEEIWAQAVGLPQLITEEVRGRVFEASFRLGRWVETARLASAIGDTSVLSLALRVPRALREHAVLIEHRDQLADLRARLETLPGTSGEPWEPGVEFFRNLNRQLGGPSGF